jgi:flavodoxin
MMKQLKTTLLMLLILCLTLAFGSTALAADNTFTDVPANAYYANAVAYVQNNGLMTGTTATGFAPNETTSRGQIAVILYRMAGSPSASSGKTFSDVAESAYYAAAVRWASANNIVSGYADGSFGPNDPITREQLAAILWRYAGSPAAGASAGFADQSSIDSYAVTAANWAQANGIINGDENSRFAPKSSATRGQVAVILQNYLTKNAAAPGTTTPTTTDKSRILIAYFSSSGNTAAVAKTLANSLNADLFELTPVTPYTSADLDWTTSGSRVNREHEDLALRDVKLTTTTPANWSEYDTVFIGYPIWWGIAAWPVNDFVKSNDFSGKTVIPFCTSTSSGLGESATLLQELAGTGTWQTGRRFSERSSQSDIESWVGTLNLK